MSFSGFTSFYCIPPVTCLGRRLLGDTYFKVSIMTSNAAFASCAHIFVSLLTQAKWSKADFLVKQESQLQFDGPNYT